MRSVANSFFCVFKYYDKFAMWSAMLDSNVRSTVIIRRSTYKIQKKDINQFSSFAHSNNF